MTATTPTTQTSRLDALRALAPAIRGRMREYDDQARFPEENFADLRDAGFLALTIPEEFGGDGLLGPGRFSDFYQILETLAHADSSTAHLFQVHCHCCATLAFHASEAQKAAIFRDVVQNGALICSAGSEASRETKEAEVYKSELVEHPPGWKLTSKKYFTSLAPAASYYLFWVAMPGTAPYAERLVWVVIPRDAPGLRLTNGWDTLGMRPTVSWTTEIADYVLLADGIIGEPGSWVRNDPRTFTLAAVANHVGTAQAAFDFTTDWVRDRRYLAESDIVKLALGQMASKLYGARAALYSAAASWDDGSDPTAAELSSIKALHLAKGVAMEVTARVFDICGARATFRTFPLERFLRDVRTFTLHSRDDLHMLTVGEAEVDGGFSAKGYHGGLVRSTGAKRS